MKSSSTKSMNKNLKGGSNNNPFAALMGNNKGQGGPGKNNGPGGPGKNNGPGSSPGGLGSSTGGPGGPSGPGGPRATGATEATGATGATGNNKGNKKPGANNNNNRTIGNRAKGLANNTTNAIQKQIGNMGESVDGLKAKLGSINQLGNINKYLMILFIGLVFAGFLFLLKFIVIKYYNSVNRAPYLIKGTKTGKHSVIIQQDPNSINYIPIKRSENQDGMEFSYSFWMLIMDVSYRPGQWKHIFHKGGSTSYPNRAPGVWLHPTKNSIRVYMNTFNNPLEYVDIDNIPVKKWVCVQVILQNVNSHVDEPKDFVEKERNHVLDVYINGTVKKSKILDSIPKQNNGDLWVNLFGGFDGYLSKLRYYDEALQYEEIQEIVKEGPSKIITADTGELPPYLDNDWWKN